ncbi:MAG: DUF819 family protein [Bacillota bacterium]
MVAAIQAAVLIILPALILQAVKRSRVLSFLGATLLCYLTGIAMANVPGLPINRSLSMRLAEVAVLLAIPLLLFSTDFVRWLRLARRTILSFVLAAAAVMVSAMVGAAVFGRFLDEAWKIGGMFVGVYTGGTANMSAIGLALGVKEEVFILVNAADVVVSGLYLIFLMTVAQRVLLRFLPAFQSSGVSPGPGGAEGGPAAYGAGPDAAAGAPGGAWVRVRQAGLAVALAVGIVAASVGLSLLLTGKLADALIILLITTLAIAASFVRGIHRLEGAFDLGTYILLVFCVSIGTIADFRELTASPVIFGYCALVLSGAILLHYLLAALFRIDADTVIITSTAAVFSPPFVAPIAAVLKNREIIVSGLTTGLVGYAVGNYLGLALAYLLHG